MTNLKIIGRTEEGIIIKTLTEKEYNAIPEMVKVDNEIIRIEGDKVTLKMLNPSKFKKEFDDIKKEPKSYKIFYSDLPDKIIVGSRIIQVVRFIY